jgi:DNA-directed RNA polymerase subunit RPC12/RpoP
MGAETYVAVAFLVGLAVGLVLVIHGTIVKNRWGVNLRRVECPDCGTVMGRVRVPASGEQAMWGGYTCPACKSELDKWGRRVARPA